ncbi:MAG: TonB-dependent receptor [Desulfobacteraceae bacterium]|nr:TonB-dependent receptor [Desulfobacteraceae bacterium]
MRLFKKIVFRISVGLSVLFMMASLCHGEEGPQKERKLETITVTAQKREENVQKVPVSMDAFDAVEIESAGMDTTAEMTRYVPNVFFKKATMENIIVVRGVSSVDASTVGPVGVYIDDVNYPLHFMHNIDLFDVERVELLRGPQGTLYGRNTESGVLNVVTRKPDNEFRGSITGTYSVYDTSHGAVPEWRTGMGVSGPVIKDRLFMGISARMEQGDGFMENTRLDSEDAAETDHRNLRGSVRWMASDRLELSFMADYGKFDDKQGLYRIFSSEGGLKNDDHTEMRGFYDTKLDQEGSGQIFKAGYDADSFDLLAITGRREYKQDSILGTGVGLSDYGDNKWRFDDTMLSQEVRISSKNENRKLEWLLGVYGFKEETDIYFSKFSDRQIRNTDMEKTGMAVFAQATLTLFDRLHFTAGGRYDHLELEGSQDLKGTDWGGNDISGDYSRDLDYDEFLPKAVISFDATGDIMLYTSVAKGYLEGGYNYAQASEADGFVFDPEYTWNYEFGVKTNWFDNRLLANCSLYHITMDDKQVSEYTAGGGIAQISNAAKANSRGVELEVRARVAQGLDLFGSFGYVDTEIDEWEAGSSDFSGNKMPNTPEYTYSAGVQYRHVNGFFGRADLLGTGEMYGNVQNDSHVKLDAYELLNLRCGYESESYDIVLWCKNVFDEEFYTSSFDYGDPHEAIGVAQNGEPREIGVTVTYRF